MSDEFLTANAARTSLDLADVEPGTVERGPRRDEVETEPQGVGHDAGQLADLKGDPPHGPALRVLGNHLDNALRQSQLVHVNRSWATDRRPAYRRYGDRRTRYASPLDRATPR